MLIPQELQLSQHLHYGENKQGTKTLTYEQSKKEEYFNRSIRLKAS